MVYNKSFFYFFILVVFILTHAGCALVPDFSKLDGQEAFEASIKERNAIEAEIEQYIGKHKNELRRIFGEPTEIISPSVWENVRYDEEWVYATGIGFLNKQYRMFYIKNDIVVHTEFGRTF